MKKIIAVFLILILLIVAGYFGYNYIKNLNSQETETNTEEETTQDTSLANPASVYCTENEGTLEIVDEGDGQVGYCVFDDGSKCEEWAFFRGECEKGEL